MLPSGLPSPEVAVWHIGPIALRAYAFCLLAGIALATWVTARRLPARGIDPDRALDVALWAVPFGIVGGRLYHVISSPQAYFGPGGDPVRALFIWEGGLGIWGAVALGALGVWLACRHYGVPFLSFGDAVAPGLALAQAVGRWGNWFNNELYGGPTDLPWALQIHQWNHAEGRAVLDSKGEAVVLGSFHPTFLYESLWCLLIAGMLFAAGRFCRNRFVWKPGQLFAAYTMLYTLGRVVIENVRIDAANHILGLRLNVWTSIVVFLFGLWWFWWLSRREAVGADDSAERTAS
ncbi:prolipoprotein diacylglyceryl transferase [Austwickia chelonae]|uniref:prolipoprotein diacylglyceryl transferase n=1 Tax=Austwickia chelonae TaxID=100225 RepID=UPI000E26C51B|nr:prolipoprotein diacylglyceryl transferase [Austwickia chelonae]